MDEWKGRGVVSVSRVGREMVLITMSASKSSRTRQSLSRLKRLTGATNTRIINHVVRPERGVRPKACVKGKGVLRLGRLL